MKTAVLRRSSKEPVLLSGITETLLIPLWARAVETRRPDAIIRDPKALAIYESLDYDFSKFDGAWMTQTGIAIRTKILDERTTDFICRHPKGVVINLGSGLSTRFSRLDNGTLHWYEVDLPEVIGLRRLFFRETKRYRFVAGSVMQSSTLECISAGRRPVLILAEGLFMYFPEEDVRAVFDRLATLFPEAEILLEMLAPCAVGMGKYDPCLSKIAGGCLDFRWTLDECRAMESWNCCLHVLQEWSVLEQYRERWGWLNLFAPDALPQLGNKIVHLCFT
ncbi:MAG TPA: class I SAM-dependent methyltransferase [Syntrophales bacterium]|nr:class I SAM-dependent methyltransferase [Syntrophales bacterium]